MMIWRSRTRQGHTITVDAPTRGYAIQQFDTLYGRGQWGPGLNCIRNDAANYNLNGGSSSGSGGSGCLGLLLAAVLICVMVGASDDDAPTTNTNEVRREYVQ